MTTKNDSYIDDAFEIFTRIEDKFECMTGSRKPDFKRLKPITYSVIISQDNIPDYNFSRLLVETNMMFGDNWAWDRYPTDDDENNPHWTIYFKYEEDAIRFMIAYPSKFLSAPVQ